MQMPWPEDNYNGYQEADVNKKAAQIKDKKLLLIHGTADGKYFSHVIILLSTATLKSSTRHLLNCSAQHSFMSYFQVKCMLNTSLCLISK